jgi:hypothetical protein
MDTLWVRRISSTKMISSVISVMNTQVLGGSHSRFSFTSTSFKTGRVYPDAICRMYSWVGSLLGSPAVICGLAIVTDDLVSMFTRYDLSTIWPLELRLSSLLLACMLTV